MNKKKPILGICIGMQVLANFGYENKKTKGLESFMHPSEEEEVDKIAGRGDEH